MDEFFKLLLPRWNAINDQITAVFVYVIGITFLLFGFYFFVRTLFQRGLIKNLTDKVVNKRRPVQPKDLHELGAEFSDDGELTLKDKFSGKEKITEAWLEFENSLVTRERNGDHVIYKTDEASLFFSEDRLLARHLNLRFWNSVPALLVGFGILGTFVGLVWGLRSFFGITDFTSDEIRGAIKKLLPGLSIAFVTSVWGMLASLLFNGLEKWRINRVSRAIAGLQHALDQLFTLTTQQEIAFRQEDELAQQTLALKAFSTDLADKIKIAMDSIMSESRAQSTQDSQKIIQELRNTPDAISNAVVNQLAPNLSNLNTTVDELQRQSGKLDDLHQSLMELHTQSTQGSQKIIQELQNVPAAISNTVTEKLALSLNNLNTTVDELKRQSEGLDALHQSLIELRVQNTQDSQKIVQELQNVPAAISNAMVEKLAPNLSNLETTVDELQRQSERLDVLHQSLIESRVQNTQDSQEIVQELRNVPSVINKVIESSLDRLNTVVKDLITAVTESKSDIQNEMELGRQEILLELHNVRDDFNNTMIENLIPSFVNLITIVSDIQSSTKEDRQEIVQGLHNLSLSVTHIQALAEAVDRVSETTISLPGHVAQIAGDIQELLKSVVSQTSEQFNQRLADMDAFFMRAAQTLQDVQHSAGTLLQLQNEQIEAINSQLSNSRATLARGRNMLQEMNSSITSVRQITETIQVVSGKLTEGSEMVERAGQQLTHAAIMFNEGNQNSVAVIRETAHQIRDALNQSQPLLNDFTQGFQIISNRLERNFQGFQTIDEGLNGIFAEIERGLNTYADTTRESINEYLSAFSEHLTQASTALARNVGTLRDSVEGLTEMNESQQLTSAAKALTGSVAALNNSIEKLNDLNEHLTAR